MINTPNTIYHIQYDYDLQGAEITVPDGCVLQFEGGNLSNGTIIGNNTDFNIEELSSNIKAEISGSWKKKGSVYVVELNRFHITPGYFTQNLEGKYDKEVYDICYNNGLGFTNAINFAFNNGYNGIVFPKEAYCFCARNKTEGRGRGSIFVMNISNFDIDLGGSTLYLIKSSKEQSPYTEVTLSKPFKERAIIFDVQMVKNVSIHNGSIIGEKFLRSYEDSEEKDWDKTNGIMQEGFCYNTKFYDLNISEFTGDAIALWIGGNFSIYENYYDINVIGNNIKVPSRKLATKIYYGDSPSTLFSRDYNTNGTTVTDYISLETFYDSINNIDNFPILQEFKRKRMFAFISQGTTLNCFWPIISILTFNENVSIDEPIRVIPSSLYGEFQLNHGETGVKIQYSNDFTGIPENVEEIDLPSSGYISAPVSSHLIIDNLNIDNCHRGGIFGGVNNTVIKNCTFFKNISNANPNIDDNGAYPDYTMAGTNYSIDWEDSYANNLTIHDCVFYGTISGGKVLLGVESCRVYNNKFIGANLTLYSNLLSIIYNNHFTNCNIGINNWPNSGTGSFYIEPNSVKYGLSNLKRVVKFYNNRIDVDTMCNGAIFANGGLNDIIDVYNNYITLNGNSGYPSYEQDTIYNGYKNINYYNNYMVFLNNRGTNSYLCRGNWYNNHIIRGCTSDTNSILLPTLMFQNNTIDNIVVYPYIVYKKEDEVYINDETYTIDNMDLYGTDIKQNIISIPTGLEKANYVFNNCSFTKARIYKSYGETPESLHTFTFNKCVFNNTLISTLASSNLQFKLKFIDCDFLNCKEPLITTPNVNIFTDIEFINCKTNGLQLFSSDEKSIIGKNYGTSEERPTYITEGFEYYDTTLKKKILWNGTDWVNLDGTIL